MGFFYSRRMTNAWKWFGFTIAFVTVIGLPFWLFERFFDED